MVFTAKERAIAIAPKITSILSMLGSSFIILHQIWTQRGAVSRRRRSTLTGVADGGPYHHEHQHHHRTNTQHRLLLGMSTCDLLVSFWFFLTTWPIPLEEHVYGAAGNQASCTAQGFFSQFSIAVAMYNASLSVYYLIKIRYGWRGQDIRRWMEPWLHGVPLMIGIGTSTAGVFLESYNSDSWECWVSPKPMDCNESWKHDGKTNCERGDNASLYRWVLYYSILWFCILLVTTNMFLVYRSVLAKERAMDRFAVDNNELQRSRRHSEKVANQGYWYCGAFYATWFFPTITRLVQVVTSETPYPLILLTAMFVPIQGCFNALVYLHPRTKSIAQSWRSFRAARRRQASLSTRQLKASSPSSHMMVGSVMIAGPRGSNVGGSDDDVDLGMTMMIGSNSSGLARPSKTSSSLEATHNEQQQQCCSPSSVAARESDQIHVVMHEDQDDDDESSTHGHGSCSHAQNGDDELSISEPMADPSEQAPP